MENAILDFSNRVVVIVGGAGGIGWRCAELFAARGAQVVACGADAGELDHARDLAIPSIYVRHIDVRSESSVSDLFDNEQVIADAGIDVLVNCAAIQHFGTAEQTSLQVWNEVMAVNVTGVFLASRQAIRPMRQRGGGSIVNLSSIHARSTNGSRVAYVASKSALAGLTRAMALDHAHENIRVNLILPGVVETPMLTHGWAQLRPDRTFEQMRSSVGRAIPMGRVGVPGDVAMAVLFLASTHSAYITGAELTVDGGITTKLALPLINADTHA